MRNAESLTHSQINEFLKGSAGIEFSGQSRVEVYGWVEEMLVSQEYQRQEKKQRGAIRAYLSKVTGLSMPQITRLIRAHARTGKVEAKAYRRQRFATKRGVFERIEQIVIAGLQIVEDDREWPMAGCAA